MKVIVNAKEVTIAQDEVPFFSGEFNVHKCTFEFSEEYNNLTKACIFTKFGVAYRRDIINNECDVPYDVLSNDGKVTIGVYAYEIQNDKIIIRYSPKPTYFNVFNGSFTESTEQEGGLTPTEYEMLLHILTTSLEMIYSNYQKKLIAGNGISIDSENDVISTDLFIPEKTSDLRNDSDFVNSNTQTLINYANKIELSLDPSTFVLKAQLKSFNDGILGYSTVDLPIESMIINGTYDSQTKELVLTLQSGQTIRISIADIISGLVPDSRTIVGINLEDNITKVELLTNLNVEDGAQVNIIESISVNGVTIVPSQNKNVNIDLSSYYTKTEANEKFVDASGDTMTGDLNIFDGNINRVKLVKNGTISIYDSTGTSESMISNDENGKTFITNGKDGSLGLYGPKANLILSGGEAKVSRNGGTASGQGSTAVGGGSTASGSYSIAISPGAQASGNQSVALGSGAQASGINSVAIGGGAMAKGSTSIAISGGANVEGAGSMSLGPNTVKGSNSFVAGAGNTSISNAGYSIGCGAANNVKGYGTLTVGENNYNSGQDSMTAGVHNFAGGIATQAEGYYSVASGNYSHAEGLGSPFTNVGTVTVLTSSKERLNGDYYTLITFNPGGLVLKKR